MNWKHQQHGKGSVSFAICNKSHEDVMDEYGIEIYEDGSVYDPCEDREFDTLIEWAVFMDTECSEHGSFEKVYGRSKYDDGEY